MRGRNKISVKPRDMRLARRGLFLKEHWVFLYDLQHTRITWTQHSRYSRVMHSNFQLLADVSDDQKETPSFVSEPSSPRALRPYLIVDHPSPFEPYETLTTTRCMPPWDRLQLRIYGGFDTLIG